VLGLQVVVSRDIDDLYETRDAAEAALAEILSDEPDLVRKVWIEAVRVDQSMN